MMKKTTNTLFLLLSLLYTSCILEENIVPVERKPQDIQIDLKMATTKVPDTRGISAKSENHVNDLYMVVFDKDGKYKFYKKAKSIVDASSDGGIKTATFAVEDEADLNRYKDVCLRFYANMDDNATGFTAYWEAQKGIEGKGMYEFEPRTYQMPATGWKATADDDFTPMPMWGGLVDTDGDRQDSEVTLKEGKNADIHVQLMRATARINVSLPDEDATTGLKIASVDLYNIHQTGYVDVPFADLSGSKYKATVPYEGSLTETDILGQVGTYSLTTPSKEFVNSIYVPETKNIGSETNDSITMIVGVTDGTNIRYSRVDFVDANGQLIDLVRNHTYNVELHFNPNGSLSGYSTKEQAMTYRTENMKYEFEIVNDKHHDVMVTDGKYLLCLSEDDFTVPLAGGEVDFVICTPPFNAGTSDCTGWYITSSEIKVNGTPTASSGIQIYKEHESTVPTWSGEKSYNYYLTMSVPAQTEATEYEIYVRCTDKFFWTLKVHQHD